MMFQHPLLLLLLLLVPGLIWWRFGRRRQPVVVYSDGAALAALPRSPLLFLRHVPAACFVAGLVCLILAAARPQQGFSLSRSETEGHDIVLLVDTSTSMRQTDFSTAASRMNRLDAAKRVMTRFIEARTEDRLGIVTFAAMPYTITPLSTDHGWLISQLDLLQTGMLEDGTAIGDALASAANRLRDSRAKTKLILLLTDGIQNAGRLSMMDAARAAAALDIKIYAVGAAGEAQARRGIFNFGAVQEIDDAALQEVADATGGRYFRATDWASLENVFKEIDQLEKTTIELEQYTRFEDRFMPFLVCGFLLLALELLLGATRLGRIPQ